MAEKVSAGDPFSFGRSKAGLAYLNRSRMLVEWGWGGEYHGGPAPGWVLCSWTSYGSWAVSWVSATPILWMRRLAWVF